ncbi:hypothetical protein AB5I41_02340 [Sphingomonas sp. MMS24-JH45]
MALSTAAAAQNTAAPTAPSPTSQTDQAAVDGQNDGADAPSSDIVVTAQGRAQVLADVPVAVSAVSAETLQIRVRTTSASSTRSRRRCS